MKLKCIAVDDEPLALGLLTSYIEQTPFLEFCGKFNNSLEALETIYKQSLHLIFLDIEMTGLNGLELAGVLSQSKSSPCPRVIFTTAYNHFAVEGYRVDALDYLLKPFDYQEFLRAAAKGRDFFKLINKTQENTITIQTDEEYLYLKVEYQLVKVAYNDILYIEGLKDYAKVHLRNQDKAILTLISLKALEEKLPVRKFMRIHRSFIVSLDKIDSISRNAVQIGKTLISVGEQYKDAFKEFLSRWA